MIALTLVYTSTTPSCSRPIPTQKSRGNSVLGVLFSHTMPKKDFRYSHRFSWEKNTLNWYITYHGYINIHLCVFLLICLRKYPFLPHIGLKYQYDYYFMFKYTLKQGLHAAHSDSSMSINHNEETYRIFASYLSLPIGQKVTNYILSSTLDC